MRSYQPRLSAAVRNALIIWPVHISANTPSSIAPFGMNDPASSDTALPVIAPVRALPPSTVKMVAPATLLNATADSKATKAIR